MFGKSTSMNKPRLNFSVVIPTYKRQEALFQCLAPLSYCFGATSRESLGFDVEVIVSDDARDASLRDSLGSLFPWCKYVEGPTRGPSANRNHGAKAACGEWLVFTDDDCLPQADWLFAFADHAEGHEVLEGRTSACGIRSRVDEECPINESGGFLWSCNFAIRRDRFLEIGGFDESFPSAAMEDVELNTRINKLNLARRFIPGALVLHPWRRRKGAEFARAYAKSVAHFVRLHPDTAPKFGLLSQLTTMLRSFKHNICLAWHMQTCAGLARQSFLDLYSQFLSWRAVNSI